MRTIMSEEFYAVVRELCVQGHSRVRYEQQWNPEGTFMGSNASRQRKANWWCEESHVDLQPHPSNI